MTNSFFSGLVFYTRLVTPNLTTLYCMLQKEGVNSFFWIATATETSSEFTGSLCLSKTFVDVLLSCLKVSRVSPEVRAAVGSKTLQLQKSSDYTWIQTSDNEKVAIRNLDLDAFIEMIEAIKKYFDSEQLTEL